MITFKGKLTPYKVHPARPPQRRHELSMLPFTLRYTVCCVKGRRIYWQTSATTNRRGFYMCLWQRGCVCLRACVSARKREHYKQRTVHRDEADGNQSLDRPGTDEVGEEETGLAAQSNHPQEHRLKPFLSERRNISARWG